MQQKANRAHVWTGRRKYIDGSPPRILVVDDNKEGAEALATYLESDGMTTRTAFGGVEAIEIGSSWIPDLIVMDISMPECNGYEASLALRKNAQTTSIAIIAFTALDEDNVRNHLEDHEFDGYCQKGQPPADLARLIRDFLDQD
jgi:two-component system OmpR family response regulator